MTVSPKPFAGQIARLALALLLPIWVVPSMLQAQNAPQPVPQPAPEPAIPETVSVGSIWESTAAPAEEAADAPKVRETASGWKPPAVMDRGILVDLQGFTLYTFDGDRRPNVSTCFGICETLWPPLFASIDSTARGEFSLVFRRDGTRQWAWRGKPLYRWARDRKPGDVTGDKVNNVWHLIRQQPGNR